ncbi:MAG: hypothetical protein LAO51_18000 [Acidobacteriia bacterium]|nr:hypothetical protein [Terriglobia bacterium]
MERCRFFDEAFASYFESLAVREFRGQQAFADDMEKSRKVFVQWVEAGKQYADTPIAEYGKHELGQLSYTNGGWSLYALHAPMGEDRFLQLTRRLVAESGAVGVDFEDLQRLAEEVAQRKLDSYFRDGFYTAESSRLLIDGVPIERIASRDR